MEFEGRRSEEENSNNTENGDLDDPSQNQTQKKPYQRYSAQQIVRMLEIYEKNTHPDENERKALGRELGLDPLRVKFWFQNRRSQNKKKDEKILNNQLKEENEKLRVDNGMLKHALGSPTCKNCGSPFNELSATRVQLLRAENAFIKEEICRVTRIMEKYHGTEVLSCLHHAMRTSPGASDSENERSSVSAAQNDSTVGEVFE